MKNYRFTFTLALLFALACNKPCDEPDIDTINGLLFEFQRTGPQGFTDEEIASVYFVRFVPFSEPLIADTLFINGNYPEGFGRFIINDRFPFRNDQSPYFTVYSYMVVEAETGFVGNVENITLRGKYDGDCGYQNLQKSFFFNGDSIDMGGRTDPFIISR
jgi:hypothetical protein